MNSESLSRRKIFQTGFSVETISLYLLCMGLNDAGGAISTKNILEIWAGSEADFAESIDILCEKNILKKIISELKDPELKDPDLKNQENTVYGLVDPDEWKL